jgi:hypothetical protein
MTGSNLTAGTCHAEMRELAWDIAPRFLRILDRRNIRLCVGVGWSLVKTLAARVCAFCSARHQSAQGHLPFVQIAGVSSAL